MSYKYSEGSQVIGDLKAADDTERDTLIDFGEDYIGLETSGSLRMVISGSDGKVGIGIDNPSYKLDINGDIRIRGNDIRDNSGNKAISFDGSANTKISGALSFEDHIMAELSIPSIDVQTDTNAFRFNCPYNMDIEGLDLYLDQHTTSGNVTVTVSQGATTMITLSITGTNTSATTTTVSNGSINANDEVTFAITATPANAQGLRANLAFRRRL